MSLHVTTPSDSMKTLPDLIDQINDLSLAESASDSQKDLLETGKSALKDIIESGTIGIPNGEDATAYYVSISGHANEEHSVGETLNISIGAVSPQEPEPQEEPAPAEA